MIVVDGLTKSFGPLKAVDGVGFTVNRGEILGFLGPNGAGKTTTMKILTGYLARDKGRVEVAGLDPGRDSLAVRQRIGYLPEHVPLYLEMFVDEYLAFTARVKNSDASATERRSQVEEAVAACRLENVFRRQIGKLSKGYRQRVGLAQALIGSPEVLILDEPTIGLDPTQIVEIRNLIKSMAGDKTILLSTHILPEVSQTCDRVVIIARGRRVAEDTPLALTSGREKVLEIALTVAGDPAVTGALLDGVVGLSGWRTDAAEKGGFRLTAAPGADPRPEVARAVVEAGLELKEMRTLHLSLEDAFVRLVTGEEEGHV